MEESYVWSVGMPMNGDSNQGDVPFHVSEQGDGPKIFC